jgi:hypothetical protein
MDFVFPNEWIEVWKKLLKLEYKQHVASKSANLVRVNSVNNINIYNRGQSLEFNSLHVKKLFKNAHQNG